MTRTKETMPAHQLHRPPPAAPVHSCTMCSAHAPFCTFCTMPAHQLHCSPPAPLHRQQLSSLYCTPPHPCTCTTLCTPCTFCTMPAHQLHSPSFCTLSHLHSFSTSEITRASFESLFQDARIAAAADWDVRVLLSLDPHPLASSQTQKKRHLTVFVALFASPADVADHGDAEELPVLVSIQLFWSTISGWSTILVSLLFISPRLLGG